MSYPSPLTISKSEPCRRLNLADVLTTVLNAAISCRFNAAGLKASLPLTLSMSASIVPLVMRPTGFLFTNRLFTLTCHGDFFGVGCT